MPDFDIKQLLIIIEQQLDWGEVATWKSKDFENLNQLIFEKTKVSLSASTLRRVWGRAEYNHLPSAVTLDTLALFAGYESWRRFLKQHRLNQDNSIKNENSATAKRYDQTRAGVKIVSGIGILGVILLLSFYLFHKKEAALMPERYAFSSRKLTVGIPNSVIFDFDATAASASDSVFIQQSWDPKTKTLVTKDQHQLTSVYYEPGFYTARLFINQQAVKEHQLMIPTKGWLGLIENKPLPLYLSADEYLRDSVMKVTASTIRAKNVTMEPQPPVVKYFNIGNFAPVSLTDFSFSTEVRNDYHEGSSACEMIIVILITDGEPIGIPLSIKGCSSDLNLVNAGQMVSGKKTDLSGFGADFSKWVKVSCKSDAGELGYYVNDKLAYECPLPKKQINIVGLAYFFQGAGAVKGICLKNSKETVFKAF